MFIKQLKETYEKLFGKKPPEEGEGPPPLPKKTISKRILIKYDKSSYKPCRKPYWIKETNPFYNWYKKNFHFTVMKDRLYDIQVKIENTEKEIDKLV